MGAIKVVNPCSPPHFFPQYGNYAHLHAMKVHLLKNAFDIRQDERIHQASRTILELCTETVAMFGRVVW